jgi:ppGpp synthetase/RelA/SpoT-type nucleotidyltranferase
LLKAGENKMNCKQLDAARELWFAEKTFFQEYGFTLKRELINIFKNAHMPVTISQRIKKDDSLLKKMLIKNKSYSEINDKIGIRVVVHFLADLNFSDKLIKENFEDRIIKRESKIETSDDKTFGYLSIHYDIVNCTSAEKPLVCELQLRTICQNAWSELAHVLSYKTGIDLPNDIKREVNALSALMEIADNQFQIILDMINKLPVSSPTRILKTLENFFYSNIAAWYDTEISHYFLKDVASLYNSDEDIIKILEDFMGKNGDDISYITTNRQDVLFFSQPEIIVILERLEKKRYTLEKYWESKFPIEQLEEVANAWGSSID